MTAAERPWLDPALPVEERAEAFLAEIAREQEGEREPRPAPARGSGGAPHDVAYGAPELSARRVGRAASVTLTVPVTNLATGPSSAVVRLYVGGESGGGATTLTDFAVVDLHAGESREVAFDVRADQLVVDAERASDVVLQTGPDAAALRSVTLTVDPDAPDTSDAPDADCA